ncbi:hypothetical protein T265_06727 [Opisthorchis viverrini]|uniref:Uncharacterized protein n=1 Tax=Opisthorchis viverrini TaxID=6198 RepID=A0A074ZJF9_OPIVI|nr:hypothetical protein T265_06727 [Opisthorchis viverrini]KER25922.1 hypothetical protein T265_06727 [Opisthorchis viverrini]
MFKPPVGLQQASSRSAVHSTPSGLYCFQEFVCGISFCPAEIVCDSPTVSSHSVLLTPLTCKSESNTNKARYKELYSKAGRKLDGKPRCSRFSLNAINIDICNFIFVGKLTQKTQTSK